MLFRFIQYIQIFLSDHGFQNCTPFWTFKKGAENHLQTLKNTQGRNDMENITYGYVRVSSKDQNIERQLIALKNAGISEKHIYIDRQSEKNFDRPAYKSMLKKLKSGDIIVTKSIDRLGRNYEEIMEQWRIITKVKGAE